MPKNRFSNRIEKPVHPVFSIPVHNPTGDSRIFTFEAAITTHNVSLLLQVHIWTIRIVILFLFFTICIFLIVNFFLLYNDFHLDRKNT